MNKQQLLILLERQKSWSEPTFGQGPKTQARIDHIRKELKEIQENPEDPIEYVDIAILSLDVLWRTSYSFSEILKYQIPTEWRYVDNLEEIKRILGVISPESPSYIRLGYWQFIFYNIINALRRMKYSDDEIFQMIYAKQIINFHRQWPAPVDEDVCIEHIREE